MNKDIRKNREALIRHFYQVPNTTGGIANGFSCACAKHQIYEHFGWDYDRSAMNITPSYKGELFTRLGMDFNLWSKVEQLYEGWSLPARNPKSMRGIADWLQTLPGWPRVL